MRYAKLNNITRRQAQENLALLRNERLHHVQAVLKYQHDASVSGDKAAALEEEVELLRGQLLSLEQRSSELARLKQQLPTIRHYLNILPKLAE